MVLKADIHQQVSVGATHEELIQIVMKFKDHGGTQREAYDQLQELWLELGFDEDESNELADESHIHH